MSYHLPVSIAHKLLERLANDDEFRQLFTKNAREALAEIGFAPATDMSIVNGIWECLPVIRLASKEAIRAGMTQLRRQLATRESMTPFALEASAQMRDRAA
jgi:putative modified peptide